MPYRVGIVAPMVAVFVHVSDIHFGQERDDRLYIHGDVKEQLIADAAEVVGALSGGLAHGILVTGDIAHSGKQKEYEEAGAWLDKLAGAVGCATYRIQMVPGNHDVDRDKSSMGSDHVIDVIRKGGSAEYEKVLANDSDRAALFARFAAYGEFCEGYDCPLDPEGRYSAELRVELAPDKAIRFVRINSALLCTGEEKDVEPELMVGARQFTLPRIRGEEIVALIHHPLNWFKDSEQARTYFRSRARVLISGHEHNPRVLVERVADGCDLMLLAAGATVPFKSSETYTFCYNVLEFDWDSERDALVVTIHPRAWNPEGTCFEADDSRLGGEHPRFVLGSPNYRKGAPQKVVAAATPEEIEPVIQMVPAPESEGEPAVSSDVEGYGPVLLKFFRDITEGERLRILIDLDAISADSDERITQGVERQLFDWLVKQGRIGQIARAIDDAMKKRKGSGVDE